MENKPYLSIVIPAYNEEQRITDTIMDISRYMSKQEYTYEILVVNDGSKDDTAEKVKDVQATVPALKFIDNEKNQGKGGVVKQGMLAAIGKYRLFVDADNAIKINHIEQFWHYVGDYDVIIGSIEIEGAAKKEEYVGFSKIYRNVLGKLSKYLVRVMTVWEIHDTQRAFKLFKEHVVEEVFKRQTITRWGFDFEVLVIAKRLGYKIKELPVKWENPPGRVTFSAYLKTLLELFKVKWNLIRGRYK